MKKSLLLIMMCIPAVLFAQAPNGVTVKGLAIQSGSVTFEVSWDKTDPYMPAVWSDSVWVFVDYNKNGVMERLPLSAGATLTKTSAEGVGKVIEVPGNNQGVWVVGNARSAGNFSATVKLLTITPDIAGACAYASNYPPVGEYTSATNISFTGTSPYEVVLRPENGGGSTITRSSGSDYDVLPGYTVQSFSDATGAPGILQCITPTAQALAASAPAFCADSPGVQLSLLGTQSGVKYYLYKSGAAVGTALPGSGSAATFSGTYTAGSYTARSVKAGAFCEVAMDGTALVNAISTPITPKITASASTACQNTNVTFNVTNPVAGATYTWSGNPAGVAGGTGNATYTVDASANVKSASAYAYITSGGITCQSANAATVTVSVVAPAVPTVAQATFCFGLPGQLQAAASNGANIAWYDAPDGGNLLAEGNVLPLSPLCNVSPPYYYAEARTVNNCASGRTQANYTVNHCVVNGTCPCFESGDIGSNVTPAACAVFDSGQIGSHVTPGACSAFDPGRIGSAGAPVACASFSAGWIGKQN